MKGTDKQVGGSHYKDNFVIQPIELINICKWNFAQGNIAKYVLRYKHKNGKEDLNKALHYIEYAQDSHITNLGENITMIELFCRVNNLPYHIQSLLESIDRGFFLPAREIVENLIAEEYDN